MCPEKHNNNRIIKIILLSVWKIVYFHMPLLPWSNKAKIQEKMYRTKLKIPQRRKTEVDDRFIY